MVIIVMGVSGAGKSTVGALLAQALGADFREGDDFHPPVNIVKMKSGIPLTDEDRWPWLETLANAIDQWLEEGRDVVLSCSALKQRYRDVLMPVDADVRLVHLKGPKDLIAARMEERDGHFMAPSLLEDQFAVLEEPENAVTVDIGGSAESICAAVIKAL